MLATIEDIREQLYTLLQALGSGWHTRADLAKKLYKNHLNPVEIAALEMLVAEGRVERLTQPAVTAGRGSNLSRNVYRIKGG
jgi:hypothetical protein